MFKRFVMPAVDTWMRKYWERLVADAPVAAADTLENALKLDTVRNIPSMGIRVYCSRMALFVLAGTFALLSTTPHATRGRL